MVNRGFPIESISAGIHEGLTGGMRSGPDPVVSQFFRLRHNVSVKPFWVKTGNETRLALVLRPQGGHLLAVEVGKIKRAGVDVLVSMLPPDEAKAFGVASEAQECEAAGIVFRSYPIAISRTPQSLSLFTSFVDQVRADLHAEQSIAVHCQSPIGRSSLFLASLMVAEGFPPDDAFRRLSETRRVEVPDTSEPVRWVQQFAARVILESR